MKIFVISLLWMLYVKGEVHISVSYGQEQSYQCLLDEDVTLTCTVTPLLKVVKWYHGETYLGQCSNQRDLCVPAGGGGTDSNYNFASDVSNKQFTLHINPVSPDTDAGTYKCQHEGESDSVTLEACVQVSVVTLKHNNQQLTTGEILEVTAGRPETLTCEPGHSRPTPTIDWYIKDDTNRKQSSIITTYELNASNEDHDQEIYCKAYNLQVESLGILSTKPKLYVRVPVSTVQLKKDNQAFNDATLTVTAGRTVNLSCTPGFSRPQNPTIDWYIGSAPKLPNNVQYRYTAEASDHGGEIFCQAYILQQTIKAKSNKPTLNINVLVTTVTLKYQSNTPSSSDRVTVTAGTAATFTCTASFSRPQAKIDWYIDGDNTPKQSSTSPTFDLTATEADHNRRIYCKAYNNIQTEAHGILSEKPVLYVQVKVTTVTLGYQGNTPSTGDTVTVTAGRAATFTCTTSDSRPQATIDWYIQDIHSTLKHSSTSPTYDLNATDADHNKKIYCKAYNNVTEAPGILSEKPMLYVQVQVSTVTLKHNNQQLVTGGELEVTAGVPERLICEPGHSRPIPTIDWYIKDDTNRKHRSTVYTYDLDANNEDHDKVIYCKAYNLQEASNGVVSTKPKLYVRVVAAIPSFLNSSSNGFTLLDGDPYTIQCQSTPTRPAAVITWKIGNNDLTSTTTREVTEDGGLVSVISTLSLYAQTSYHNSEIICESKISRQTKTPETRATLIIWWRPIKPLIQTINGDFPWAEGGQGEFTCLSTDYGNPSATIKWTPNIGTMNAENRLVINNLSYMDHRRSVKCRMENSFTTEKKEIVESDEITLNVLFSPKFKTTDVVFVGKIQENVTITFSIYSNPKDVTPKLFVNGSVTNNNNKEKYVLEINEGVSEELNVTITIVDLEEGDFANYLLDVTNVIGTTEVNFTVTAESIPSAPTSFGLKELRGSVAIFYWERGFNGGHKQYFLLQLRSDTEDSWSNRTIVEEHDMNSNLGNTSYIANISGLNPGTYRVRLIAVNSIGAAEPVLLETTFTIPTKGEPEAFPVAAAVGGGVGAALLIIAIVAVVLVIRKRRSPKNDDNRNFIPPKRGPDSSDSCELVTTKNEMYESADNIRRQPNGNDVYAQVNKPSNIYAKVSKALKKKSPEPTNDVYSQVQKPKKKEKKPKVADKKKKEKKEKNKNQKEDVYENVESQTDKTQDDKTYENHQCSIEDEKPTRTKNQDGLIYVDVDLPNKTDANNKRPIIHGEDDRTIYAEVAIGEVGEPLPESDEETTTEKQ